MIVGYIACILLWKLWKIAKCRVFCLVKNGSLPAFYSKRNFNYNSGVLEFFQKGVGMIANTAPFDITGHPALSLNAGGIRGLPVGM